MPSASVTANHPSPPREDPLFSPTLLGTLRLANRLAVAPMTRVSASPDGRATLEMVTYYSSYAEGGFGLVITEGIYTDRVYAQCYANQPGLTDADQVASWRGVTDTVHRAGAPIIAQLMHGGALSQHNIFRQDTIGPSALRPVGEQMRNYGGSGKYKLPRSADERDLGEVIAGFSRAALHAREAGFDGVEVHGANGYLLHQFLSEDSNQRGDRYGGSVLHRAAFTASVIAAVRKAVGAAYPVGVRLSQGKVNDFGHRWAGGVVDGEIIFRACVGAGADFVHTTQNEAWTPAFGPGTPSMAALARSTTGLPVIANGALHHPQQARGLLERDDAQLVSLARGALASAAWPNEVRSGHQPRPYDPGILQPSATLASAEAWRARARHRERDR